MPDSTANPETPLDSDGLLPWRFLLRAVASVFRLHYLLGAAAGVVVAAAGEGLLAALAGVEPVDSRAAHPLSDAQALAYTAALGPLGYWWSIIQPFWDSAAMPWQALVGVWRVAVALLTGGYLARSAAQYLTFHKRSEPRDHLQRSLRNWPGAMAALAGLVAVVVFLMLPLLAHAWMLHSRWLEIFSAVLLPIPLLFALAGAVLAVCGAVGWPLLAAAGAAERPDPFDAASRALAYATQRPTHLAAYLLVALAVAAPVAVLLELVAGVGLAASHAAIAAGVEASSQTAGRLATFWTKGLFGLLTSTFYTGYFWSATIAIYLLLRRDIDSVQVDELDSS